MRFRFYSRRSDHPRLSRCCWVTSISFPRGYPPFLPTWWPLLLVGFGTPCCSCPAAPAGTGRASRGAAAAGKAGPALIATDNPGANTAPAPYPGRHQPDRPAARLCRPATAAGAGPGRREAAIGIFLLALCTLLIPFGLLARALQGRMNEGLASALTWAGLIAGGFASSLLVLTVIRDLLLLPAMAVLRSGTLLAAAWYSAWGVP